MRIKILIIIFLVSAFISSCSKSANDGTGLTSGPSWSLTVDGVNYSWSGPLQQTVKNNGEAIYIASDGSSLGLPSSAAIMLSNNTINGVSPQMVTAQLSSITTGTFIMSLTSYENSFVLITNSNMYSSAYPGSNITFKVNSLSNNTLITSGLSGVGYVKGTFSGTISDLNGGSHSISGSYNCMRMQ